MRPLPITRVAEGPPYLLGIAVIRGGPVPVVSLSQLLGDAPAVSSGPARLVTVRRAAAAADLVALAVDAVLGTRDLPAALLHKLPPLLSDTHPGLGASLAILDSELCVVLREARVLPEGLALGASAAPIASAGSAASATGSAWGEALS